MEVPGVGSDGNRNCRRPREGGVLGAPGRSVSGKDRQYRCIRCVEGIYLGVDALVDGEMRVHVFTDTSAPRLRAACAALPTPPLEPRFTLRQGRDAPARLYAGFSWQLLGNDYAPEQARATEALNWLAAHVIPALEH